MRKKLKDKTFSEFVSDSIAINVGGQWTVYCDGENMMGAITKCEGANEFEAKENAWEFIKSIFDELRKNFNS